MAKNNFSEYPAYVNAVEKNPGAKKALCFGDSWFQYVPHPTDINKQLAARFTKTLFMNEGLAGRDSASWARGMRRIQHEIAEQKFDAILVSHGGNDVVGDEMKFFLKTPPQTQLVGTMQWGQIPRVVFDYVKLDIFEHALTYILKELVELVAYRKMYSPNCPIYIHTYDYIYPSGKAFKLGPFKSGPWVKPHLEDVGLTDPLQQRELTSWLLDQYRRVLMEFQTQHLPFFVVNSLGTLSSADQWENEIHPVKEGFADIAHKRWVPALQGVLA